MEVALLIMYLSYLVLSNCEMQPFIAGGENAKIGDFSYVAFLGVECVDENKLYVDAWNCGSSILNQDITLTAGHCVFGCKEKTLIIVSVGHERMLEGAISTGHSFIIHEYYSNMWMANDIALVRLQTPIQFSLNVSRVALVENPPYNEEGVVAGWGLNGHIDGQGKTISKDLKYIKQYVWEKKQCVDLVKRMVHGTFCAGSKNEFRYPAEGDSGSPLVVRGYIQIGIVSSKASKFNSSVTVYTDIGFFYDWITEHADIIMCPQESSEVLIV